MIVRVIQTVAVSDDYRRQINEHYGRPGLATREQVRRWIKTFGSSMDDDLAQRDDDKRWQRLDAESARR